MKLNRLQRSAAIAFVAAIVASILLVGLAGKSEKSDKVVYTVGDVQAMHAKVTLGEREVRGKARLADGDRLRTSPDGRARLRLDDATLVVVDSSTDFTLHGSGITLNQGRLFVQGEAASRIEVTLGAATATVSSSAAAFEANAGSDRKRHDKIYCVQGELVVRAGGRQERIASGEMASIESNGPKVAPEKAFDDWTGGLAVPWAGETGLHSAIAELWGRRGGDDPGKPLAIRSEAIETTIDGELAVTRTRTRYFNGTEGSVRAEIRMAAPPGAILSRVALVEGESESSVREALLLPGKLEAQPSYPTGQLSWAGNGWLRGELPSIVSGATVELIVEYVEWLPTRAGGATYRFPMAQTGEAPLVGDLSAKVDVKRTDTAWIRASNGTSVHDRTVELHRADARPNGDLVVELAPSIVMPGAARAYVTSGDKGEDPYVMIRTEVPEKTEVGVSLALVVDTSMSAGASALESERAVVDALLEGLGSRDSLVVMAADQTVRPLGSPKPAPVTAALRADVRKSLASIRAGGSSNLALALEHAADVLDAQASGNQSGSGMVVYIGDGRPTVGELEARDIRRRLTRRVGGMPRLGAVAVGEGANRWLLARLVAGSGPVYEVADRSEAASVGASLVADALEPTHRNVGLDLGPNIDRIYPREARAALAGSTVTVVGRLRGRLPARIGFRFRDSVKLVEESRKLVSVTVPEGADVPRRWAAARIEEIMARGDGIEAARVLASQAKLLTPWTSWFFASPGDTSPHACVPFEQRLLGLSPTLDASFAPYIEPAAVNSSLLLEPPRTLSGGVTLIEGAQAAAHRTIGEAYGALRACRDARAAMRTDVVGSLRINLVVNPEGKATEVRATAAQPQDDDPALDRCVKGIIESLPFFGAGKPMTLSHELTILPGRGSQRTRCSPTAALPFPVRRGIWRARSLHGAERYVQAARSCELPSWRDRRALLELSLDETSNSEQRLLLASALDAAGEPDAAAFVRNEALRRVTTAEELARVSRALMIGEPVIDGAFDKAYRAATSDEKRLDVVRRFLRIAPHSALARRRLLAVLEVLGRKEALVLAIDRVRSDPFADAGLLAAGASALRRVGQDAEGRRAFGELVERAPGDPWTLAFAGDRLRAENLFDEAVANYDSLARALPDDPAVSLRLALAHAGAGRLDVATRLLERVAQNGGRGDDGRLGELASMTQAVLLASARSVSAGPDVDAQLMRRLVQTPLPDVKSLVVITMPPTEDAIHVSVARERAEHDEQPADLDAPSLGLAAVRIERGEGLALNRLKRPANSDAIRTAHATVSALILAEDRAASKVVTRQVDVAPNGVAIELRWDGESFL